jgi:hypothetical protein
VPKVCRNRANYSQKLDPDERVFERVSEISDCQCGDAEFEAAGPARRIALLWKRVACVYEALTFSGTLRIPNVFFFGSDFN